MSSPSPSVPTRRRLIIGGSLAVLVVLGVVLGIWLGNRSNANGSDADPSSPVTVALPTSYPTEAPPATPITQPTAPAPEATVPITSPQSVTAASVPGFTAEEPVTDEEVLEEGAVAAEQNTYTSRGQEVEVAASQWPTEEDAAARAEALRAAAPGDLIQERTFGPNGEGTYWYYEQDGVATQVWLIGDVAGSFTGDPTETQNLALRLLASR